MFTYLIINKCFTSLAQMIVIKTICTKLNKVYSLSIWTDSMIYQACYNKSWVLSSFLRCLSLWLVNEKVRNRWRGVDELYGFYLLRHANGLTHVCLIASSVKIIAIKRIAVVYGFKSPGWFDVETCTHVLGLWHANTAGAIKRVGRLW